MSCEIVKAWVGNMENTYFYCRDHRVECQSATVCGLPEPAPTTTPRYSIEVGDMYRCLKPPRYGQWKYQFMYQICAMNRTTDEVILFDEQGLYITMPVSELLVCFDRDKGASVLSNGQPVASGGVSSCCGATITPCNCGSCLGDLQCSACRRFIGAGTIPQAQVSSQAQQGITPQAQVSSQCCGAPLKKTQRNGTYDQCQSCGRVY